MCVCCKEVKVTTQKVIVIYSRTGKKEETLATVGHLDELALPD